MSNPVEGKSLVVDLDLELCPTHCGYCGGFGSLSQVLIINWRRISWNDISGSCI